MIHVSANIDVTTYEFICDADTLVNDFTICMCILIIIFLFINVFTELRCVRCFFGGCSAPTSNSNSPNLLHLTEIISGTLSTTQRTGLCAEEHHNNPDSRASSIEAFFGLWGCFCLQTKGTVITCRSWLWFSHRSCRKRRMGFMMPTEGPISTSTSCSGCSGAGHRGAAGDTEGLELKGRTMVCGKPSCCDPDVERERKKQTKNEM